MKTQIILASNSPRRKELLKSLGYDFTIVNNKIKETYPDNLDVFLVPLYISEQKSYNVYKDYSDALVIGCDTSIIFNNEIIGKPLNKQDAKITLLKLSNNYHYVVTGLTIYYKNNKYQINSINKVYFKKLTQQSIDEYLLDDEYKDKAGSYAIQGKGFKFIEKFEGEYESIVGLPIKELSKLLNELSQN